MVFRAHHIIKSNSLIAMALILLIGCNDLVSPQPERLGYEYFPLQTGNFRIYQVEVINYNIDGSSDTLNYQIQEITGDSSRVGDEVNYRLNRFRRSDASVPWVIDSVWAARRNTYQAIVVEHNIPIIKLSFPLSEDRRWDGNAMNVIDSEEFKIENFNKPYEMDSIIYPQSLEMYKEDLIDSLKFTNDDYHLEVFSKGVGLIHKLDINKKYCNPIDCSGEPVIIEGIVFEQKLLPIGKIN